MRKKVLFTIASLRGGGAERALSNIVTHFPDDWDVDILLNNERMIEYPYKGEIISLSLPDYRNGKTLIYFLQELFRRTRYLRIIKRKNHYDACISFLDSANISNILSGNRYCKTIVSMRLNMTSKKSGLLYRVSAFPLIKFLYSRADKIVAVSKEIELDVKKRFHIPAGKLTTIINGYDVVGIRCCMQKRPEGARIPKGKKMVVTVGRLDSQKGQWHLIRAFAKVVKQEPDVVLYIIGTGEYEHYLRKLIHMHNMEKHILLIGFQSNPFWYNAQAEVFVLPSMYEGFPNALVEAMCCGIPCIATDFHSGAREILAPDMDIMGGRINDITEAQYGVLTPMCSGNMYQGIEPLELEEIKLAEAIVMLLHDKKKNQYYREQSIVRSDMMGIQAIVPQWLQVITESKECND